MKDIEWLKKEVDGIKLDIQQSGGYHDTEMVYYEDLIELISQVEQPALPVIPDGLKVDMQVGFDEGVEGYSNVSIPEAVEILGDYDVTVQQPELPVIPEYVAEWIRKSKRMYSLEGSLVYAPENVKMWTMNISTCDTFARAWLDGYIVEEKKLTAKDVIEQHIEYLKTKKEAIDLKPYYDLLKEIGNE